MLGRLLVFVGGVVVLLLFAALLAPLFIDWTGFRQQFEDQASRIIGKKVVVHGSVDARLLPFPSITMNDVRVGQEPDGTPQVQISRFSMDAELAPVLSGEALIYDMRIEEMTAHIRLLKDGTLDWMRGSRPEIPARSIVLENVQVKNGNITFIDEQSGRTRQLSNLNAAMSAKTLAGPWKAVGDAVLDGEPGRFSLSTNINDGRQAGLWVRARIMPANRPVGAELEGALTVSREGKPNYRGSFLAFLQQKEETAKAQQDQVSPPRLKGTFELTNERIRIPDYQLEVGDQADPYIVTGEATLDTGKDPEFLLLADGQQIDVSRIDYNGDAGKTGRDPGDTVRKRLQRFIDIAASIPVPSVPGRASLKLPAILIGDTAIRDVRVDVRPTSGGWLVDDAIATLPGRTAMEAKGVLGLKGTPGFNGHLLVASRQPSGLSSWLSGSVDPAIRDLKTLGFDADVRLTPELQRFDGLELQLGDATLKGRIERQSIEGETPALTAALSGNRIDLDQIRGLSTLFGRDGKADLSSHAIAAELKAGEFSAFGMQAKQAETVFTLSGGALSVERFNTRDLAGAQVTAIGRADLTKDGLDANGRLSFKAADPSSFLAMLSRKLPADPLLGHLLRHAGWFANSEFKITLAAGGKDKTGLSMKLAGTSNGSRVDLDLGMQDPAAYPANAGLNLQVTLENPKANILLGQAGLDPLPFDSAEKGVLSLRLAGTRDNDADIALAFNAGKTSVDLKGRASLYDPAGISGAFQTRLASDDATPYLVMTGVTLPQMGLGLPGQVSANLQLAPDRIALSNLTGSIGGNGIEGHLEFDRRAGGLKGTGALSLAQADLGWLAEAVYGEVTNPEGGYSDATFSNGILAGANFSLDLTAKTFWPDIAGPVRNFRAKVTGSDGELLLGDISGEWSGAALAGSLRMGNSNGSGYFQASFNADHGNTPGISWYVNGAPLLDGKFGLKLSGEAAGKSMKELVAGLGGSGEVRLSGLKVHGLNLDILNPVLTTMDLTEGEINTARVNPLVDTLLDQGTTALGEVTVPFSLGGGKLAVQPVTVTDPRATVTGEGEADLLEGRLRASVTLGLVPGQNAVDGAEPGLRLDFAGPTPAPERTVDTLGLTNFLSLRAFEKERHRVERLQSIAVEKLRLRREAAYFAARAEARTKAAADARAREEAEARAREEAAAAARLAADKAAAEAKAADDAAKAQQVQPPVQTPETPVAPQLPVSPQDSVTRGGSLPPPPL